MICKLTALLECFNLLQNFVKSFCIRNVFYTEKITIEDVDGFSNIDI